MTNLDDLLDLAIEEMLRYTNPVQHIAIRYPLTGYAGVAV